MNGIGLTPAQLAAVFPFHVGCDGHLIITQTSSGWARVSGSVRPGAAVADCFRIVRPELPMGAQALRSLEGSLVILECLSNGLPLRGQIVCVSGTDDLLFIGSPWVREAADLERFELSLAEWPPHESVAEDQVFAIAGGQPLLPDDAGEHRLSPFVLMETISEVVFFLKALKTYSR